MKAFYSVLFLTLFLTNVLSLRLFMIGGHAFEQSALFNDLAAAVANREPLPNNCISDWKITKCPRIAVITSSHETEAQGDNVYYNDDQQGLGYQHIFNIFGMSPQHISVHADNYQITTSISTQKGKQNYEILMTADIYYFTGGDQSKHVRAWLNDDGTQSQLLSLIKIRVLNDEVIVSGSSAGSMIYDQNTYGYGSPYGVLYFANSVSLAPKMIQDAAVNGTNLYDMRNGSNCIEHDQNAGKMPGFNWIDIIFDTHFHVWGRIGRITAVMVDLKRNIGIGLDENTSFFYQNGYGKVFGENGVTIFDLTDSIKPQSKYFQLQNVKVHYLTQGDRYDFKNKIITSSKTLITIPYYKNNTDSQDIFNSYQGSLLLTRLVDQTALYNKGRSIIPEGYPNDSPVFQITFSKNAQTKGYKRGNSYTVVNAILDYSYVNSKQQGNTLSYQ